MHVELSSDASRFIDSLVSSGDFRTPSDAVAEGIRLLMSRENLLAEIQVGIDAADAGNLIDADEVYAEARRRIQAGIDDLDAGRWVNGETMFAELREQNAKIVPENSGQ